jgi:hypothetical protein
VMQIDPLTSLPVWGPGGPGSTTAVATTLTAGVLTVTVGSASSPTGVSANVNLRGQLLEDAFGVDLGYLLPL